MLQFNTLSTFLFGEAEYFDVFDKWHRTKFCYRLTGSTSSVNDDSIGGYSTIGQNMHTFVPERLEVVRRNNCIDDQCENNRIRPALDRPALKLVKEYQPPPNPYPPNALFRVERRSPPR
jgi:hypothetical protein